MQRITLFLWVFILSSCAKIVPPDGGDRDTEAPRDTVMVPLNLSTNFKSKTIYIEFNEYVRLNDIYNQLIVSPPLNERPEIILKRKGVYLTFNEELMPDVTYTLNFGEGIVDITEGNSAENLIYVFTTGEELDSLSIRGKVVDAFTGAPVDGAKVMLYRDLDALPPGEVLPTYFTRTGSDGIYQFNYLKEGQYMLFALVDKNYNYFFDDFSEALAFTDTLVSAQPLSSLNTLGDLRVSLARDTMQYLEDYQLDSTGFLRSKLHRELLETDSFSMEISDQRIVHKYWIEEPDSLFAWTLDYPSGSYAWHFRAASQRDTIDVEEFDVPVRTLKVRTGLPSSARSEDTLTLRFDHPIYTSDFTKMTVMEDSVPVPFTTVEKDDPFAVSFVFQKKEDALYVVELQPNAVSSDTGWVNDSLRYEVRTHSNEHYGTIELALRMEYQIPNAILQLTNSNGDVVDVRPVETAGKLIFSRLLPGSYRLRIFSDMNNNGRWDPVEPFVGRQPEPMLNMPEMITVRSNWELSIDWLIQK